MKHPSEPFPNEKEINGQDEFFLETGNWVLGKIFDHLITRHIPKHCQEDEIVVLACDDSLYRQSNHFITRMVKLVSGNNPQAAPDTSPQASSVHFYAMQCNAMQCNAIQGSSALCSAVQCTSVV